MKSTSKSCRPVLHLQWPIDLKSSTYYYSTQWVEYRMFWTIHLASQIMLISRTTKHQTTLNYERNMFSMASQLKGRLIVVLEIEMSWTKSDCFPNSIVSSLFHASFVLSLKLKWYRENSIQAETETQGESTAAIFAPVSCLRYDFCYLFHHVAKQRHYY
jgi:hypothetical protein